MSEVVSIETLHQLLICDAENGRLFWRARGKSQAWDTRYSGKPALNYLDPVSGYLRGAVFNKTYQAHRVIWSMVNGRWPNDQVDHINGNRADNRIVNLREATQAQNKANGGKRIRRNPSSRFIGVERIASTGRWGASVPANGQRNWCGTFATEEEAAKARDAMAIKVRGEFARLNFPKVSA